MSILKLSPFLQRLRPVLYHDGAFVKQKNWFRIFISAGTLLLVFVVFDSAFVEAAGFQINTPFLMLHDGQGEYLLGNYVEYLEDPSQTLDIKQASSADYSNKFTRGNVEILNFGLKDSVYWLRFTVENESLSGKHWLLELARPSMNSVSLYTPLSNGNGFTETKTGYIFPFTTRDIPHENFVFDLDIPPGNTQTYYLRVKDMSLDLPLRIWSDHAFDIHDQTSRLIIALSFGALLTMLIYNIILIFIMRNLGYVSYAFFQFFLLLYLGSVQGYAPRYLWHNVTFLNFFAIPLFIELAMIFQLLFIWDFLRFDSRAKWLDYTCYILIALFVLSIPPTLSIGAKTLSVVLPVVLIGHVYVLVLGIWAIWRGYKPARYYLFAWSIYLIVGFVAVLQHMGWFTVKQMIPEQALQFGAVYLVIFQSFALADRINYYKQEHLNAQSRLILQQKETLSLKDQLNTTLENARLELEERVDLRTRELIDLNAQLSEEIAERKHAEDELKRLASVDFLTGLFNRRHFFEIARYEFVKSTRYNNPLSVIIFDIDIFKSVNDTHGHLVGDQALAHIGKLVLEITRKSDIPARYGGEEFIILLPETTCKSAQIFAERLRRLVEDSPVFCGDHSIQLTISVGVSGKDNKENTDSFDQLISQADEALYKAKNAGRNRVICHWDDVSKFELRKTDGMDN
jgi:diguanylate cyclase (GGDEF)-like protein